MSLQKVNPDLPFLSYGEIFRLAVQKKYAQSSCQMAIRDQLEFLEELVVQINAAIEDRDIVPVILEKPESTIGSFDHYLAPLKESGALFLLLAGAVGLKYAWDNTDVKQQILQDDPNFDMWGVITKMMFILACSALVPLFSAAYKFLKVVVYKSKSHTSEGMIKYQILEAKNRGYTSYAYYTDSVLDFLDATSGVATRSAEEHEHQQKFLSFEENKTEASGTDFTDQRLDELGVRLLVYSPLKKAVKKELSKKFSDIAKTGHQPLNDAKAKLREVIGHEISKPTCTCYHNQIARHIIKSHKSTRTYLTKQGIRELSESTVMDIAKEVMKKHDPARVCSKTVAKRRCPKHKTY